MTTKVNVIVNDAKPLQVDLAKDPAIGEELLITKEGEPCHLRIERMEHQLEEGKEKAILLYCEELRTTEGFDIFALI
ncbi:MAG: hypothetical protein ACRCYN_01760 [Plesiomonas sp.]